jgi:multiple sugar transport system substrate-binding protein
MMSTSVHSGASRRRRLALGTISVVAGLALAACGGGATPEEAAQGGGAEAPEFTGEYDGPEVTLSYWNGFTGGDGPFMTQMVDDFMAEHPNIKVESNTVQWAEFYQRVPAAVNAGEGPDVGVMHLTQIATNAARNVIVPLDDLAENLELSADDFTEEVWDASVYNDQRYGIPLDVHSLAMYYNQDHFTAAGITEAPTDLASLEDAIAKLQAAGYSTPLWMPQRWPAHLIYLSLLWQNGGEPYSEEGDEALYNSPEGVESMEFMRGAVDQGWSPSNVDPDAEYVAFKNGEVSIHFNGIWQINDLEATEGLTYGIAPFPTIGEEDAVWADSHNFFITKQATDDENKYAAAQVFVAWISEQSGEWAGSGMIPARQSVRDSGALEGLPQAVIAEKIDTMRFLPPIPGVPTVQGEALEPAISEAVLGNAEPEAAMTTAAEQASELMKRNLESFGG